MSKKMTIVVKKQRPVCRTPIKPVQKHKNDVKFNRKQKHTMNLSCFLIKEA